MMVWIFRDKPIALKFRDCISTLPNSFQFGTVQETDIKLVKQQISVF